jgi:branched-chain amino acid transport system substrate-binding protein
LSILRPSFRLVALLSLLFLAACAQPKPPPPPPPPVAAAPPVAKPAPKPAPKPLPPAPAEKPAPQVAPPGATQVALLLPLSGNAATLGNAMLNAAQLALFELADNELTLLPFDSKGTAEGAEAAARQAVAQRVDVIVGPLFAAEVRAVSAQAAPAHIPVISLSADRSVAGGGTYVLGFLPGPQAIAVSDFAAAAGKLRQAVLAPANDYGRTVVGELNNAAQPLGVSLGPVEYYDPAALDLVPVLKRLLAARKADDVGFDALLLPDDGARLRRVGEQWAAQGVEPGRVQLLGTMLWDEAKLGDPFAGAWFAAAPAAGFADFARRYQAAFGAPPPRLASLAYDAAALTMVLARGNPHDFSVGILTNPQGFAGVDGLFRLKPNGSIERAYAIKQVTANAPPREIQPAATKWAAGG